MEVIVIKSFIGMLKVDFYRAIFSWNFLVGITATLGIFYFGSVGMMYGQTSAVAAFNNTFKYNNISQLLVLTSTFTYASCFAEDWQTGFYNQLIIRGTKNTYLFSKCIATSISSGLCLVIGTVIFISITCFKLPNMLPSTYMIEMEFGYQAFGDLLVNGQAIGFFSCYLYVIFMQAAFFATLGLCITSYFPNKYVAYISPFALAFVIKELTDVFNIPIWLDPTRMASARIFDTPTQTILIIVTLLFLSLIILCSGIFVIRAKRRLANG